MNYPCWFLSWMLAMFVGVVLGDFDIHTGSGAEYEFTYDRSHELLLTMTRQGCYFALVEKRHHLHDQLDVNIENDIKTLIAKQGSLRKESTTLDEMNFKFNNPPGVGNCTSRDIYFVQLDFMACAFDTAEGLCSWEDHSPESFHWHLHSGATTSTLTGPDADHTTGAGQYVYIESNDGHRGQVAMLKSPMLSATHDYCLQFWYYMYGQGIGNLSVLPMDVHQGGTNHPIITESLWTVAGNQGQEWRLAEVYVPAHVVPANRHSDRAWMRLKIKASRGPDIYGDIAVDDVSSMPGRCLTGRLDCSFENGTASLCEWTQVGAVDQMDWRRNTGGTDTAGTGPHHSDAKVGGRYYLYLEGDAGYAGDHADLQSPVLHLPHALCLHFLYFMEGTGVGDLQVILLDLATRTETVLWERQGQQLQHAGQWNSAQVSVYFPDPDTPVQIILRGTRGTSVTSDVALDEIRGVSGTCDLSSSGTIPIIG